MLAYYYSPAILHRLVSINTDIAVAIIAGSVTIFVSVISVLFSKHLENNAFLRNGLREKKVPVYEEIMEIIFEIIYFQPNEKSKQLPDSTKTKITGFVPKLITWGSDSVTKSFSEFREVALNKQRDNSAMAKALASLMLEMRKDLGHCNEGLSHESILRIFINDPVLTSQTNKNEMPKK